MASFNKPQQKTTKSQLIQYAEDQKIRRKQKKQELENLKKQNFIFSEENKQFKVILKQQELVLEEIKAELKQQKLINELIKVVFYMNCYGEEIK